MTLQIVPPTKRVNPVRKPVAPRKSKTKPVTGAGHAMDVFSDGKRCAPGKSLFAYGGKKKK